MLDRRRRRRRRRGRRGRGRRGRGRRRRRRTFNFFSALTSLDLHALCITTAWLRACRACQVSFLKLPACMSRWIY